MVDRRNSRKDRTLVYPKHALNPNDLLNFIELSGFTKVWDSLNQENADQALEVLQVMIMCNPKVGAVIPGTDGLRKIRFAKADSAEGKSGGLRVCYVYYERFFMVLLAIVYPKATKVNLSASDKKRVNKAIKRIEEGLERRFA